MLDLRPDNRQSPLARVAQVRSRTEAVFEATLDAMLGAIEDLSLTEASLCALAETLSPAALVRLRGLQPQLHELSGEVQAKADRCRRAASDLGRLMAESRGQLDDLRRLARTATLVSLNALVVSRTLNADGGMIDSLAIHMREVLAEVGRLVADLAARIAAAESHLREVEQAAAALAVQTEDDTLPAIRDFAQLLQVRSRDDRVARSASLVSKRLRSLQDGVGQVVTHLQVGDGFRQRLEHIEAILRMAQEPEASGLAGILHSLAAAQIRAALDDLGASLRRARRHLGVIGRSATDISRAGAVDALRGGSQNGLGVLVAGSARIERVIGDLGDASDRLSRATRGLTETLAGAGQDAGAAAEFERRMTVLGLNAILLASRLGSEGRAMEEVAQQQRDIARSITEAISGLRSDLEQVVRTSGSLDSPQDSTLGCSLATAAEAAKEITALSGRVRDQLAAIGGLRDSTEMAVMVDHANQDLAAYADLAAELDEVAQELEVQNPKSTPDAALPVLARVRALYSMQAERDVHDRLLPGANAACAPHDIEDDIVFF